MPDTRFSWRALREHIRKYLWIYLVGIVVSLFGTNLLWTATRPQLLNEECVTIYLADNYSNPEALSDIAEDMFARTKPFDDALKEVSFQSMLYSEDDYNSSMLLVTRLAVGEPDAFLASAPAMAALIGSQVLVPLDDYYKQGWLAKYGLEPYYATLTDEDAAQSVTFLAGFRLDGVDALLKRGAFNAEGAFLCVTSNGGNVETTMKALEFMMEDLTGDEAEAEDAETENI